MTDAQKYVARLISGYAEMPGMPMTTVDGQWWVRCSGYVVDMLFAGPFASQEQAQTVVDACTPMTNNAGFTIEHEVTPGTFVSVAP